MGDIHYACWVSVEGLAAFLVEIKLDFSPNKKWERNNILTQNPFIPTRNAVKTSTETQHKIKNNIQ